MNAAQTSLLKPGNLEQLTRKTEINDAQGLLNDFYLKNKNAKYQGPKIDLMPKLPIKFKNPTIRLTAKSNIESLTMIPKINTDLNTKGQKSFFRQEKPQYKINGIVNKQIVLNDAKTASNASLI